MLQLVIHGGAGSLEGKTTKAREIHQSLCIIWEKTFELLKKMTAEEAVIRGIRLLEDDPIFNAGTGSKLQADGEVRMSAALMDGVKNSFSGVINVQNIRFPIAAAALLSKEKNKVLSADQATEFCRKHGFDEHDPVTPARLQEYEQDCSGIKTTIINNLIYIFSTNLRKFKILFGFNHPYFTSSWTSRFGCRKSFRRSTFFCS